MKPNTGHIDCDTWIIDTFRREEKESQITGEKLPQLRIKKMHEHVLDEEKTRGLIRYLQSLFCFNCDGSGLDTDTRDGRCEYCNENLPF